MILDALTHFSFVAFCGLAFVAGVVLAIRDWRRERRAARRYVRPVK